MNCLKKLKKILFVLEVLFSVFIISTGVNFIFSLILFFTNQKVLFMNLEILFLSALFFLVPLISLIAVNQFYKACEKNDYNR